MDPINSLGPVMWSFALTGIGCDITIILQPAFIFRAHHIAIAARVPKMATLVRYDIKNPTMLFIDLTNEERHLMMCLLEFIYVGNYTSYFDGENLAQPLAQRAALQLQFHYRMYLLGGRYNFLALQAFAWNRVQYFRQLVQHVATQQAATQQAAPQQVAPQQAAPQQPAPPQQHGQP